MLKGFVLIGGALLAATPVSLFAQVGGCSACETAIRDKLTELDDRTGRTNLLVKTVDRKLDPLAVKVDSIDTRLTAVQAKLDGIAAAAPPAKSAVVIDTGSSTNLDLAYIVISGGGLFVTHADAAAKTFCNKLNYPNGKALVYSQILDGRQIVTKMVCFV